jgi:hypothetical protein
MTAQQPQRCHICGAEMSAENPEICKNFHVQRAQQPQRDCSTCIEDRTDNCPAKQFNKFLVQFTGCLFHSSRPHTPSPDEYQTGEHDAMIAENVINAILTRITEAQYDKSTMQDFINYIESLRDQTAGDEQHG